MYKFLAEMLEVLPCATYYKRQVRGRTCMTRFCVQNPNAVNLCLLINVLAHLLLNVGMLLAFVLYVVAGLCIKEDL